MYNSKVVAQHIVVPLHLLCICSDRFPSLARPRKDKYRYQEGVDYLPSLLPSLEIEELQFAVVS